MSRDKVKIRLCEINKHVSDGINKDRENQNGAKEFSKSEGEWVDVMDTLQHAISIIEKEIAKNFAFLQKERPKVKEPSANSVDEEAYHRADHRRFTRKHSRPRKLVL